MKTMELAQELISEMSDKGYTISAVESFTGGAFLSQLVQVQGASKVVFGGIVAYKNEIKEQLLQVTKIEQYGVVSKQVAEELAINGNRKFHSSITVSFTGNAGPTRENGQVGQLYIGYLFPKKNLIFVEEHFYKGKRTTIIDKAIRTALEKVLQIIK